MARNQKFRQMERVIRDADLPQKELIDLLAMFMSDIEPHKAVEWFKEIKQSRADLERRSNTLIAEWERRELERFDPNI